jgi:quercetin dioxygenase-like cupin family protein
MICMNTRDINAIQVKETEYRGNVFPVKNVWVKWLTHKDLGGEEYQHNHALRHFTIGPKGEIPMHSHKFTQIMYLISGTVICSVVDKDGKIEDREMAPGDFAYIYSFEPHTIKNPGDSEPAVLLCCIDCVDDKNNCISPA